MSAHPVIYVLRDTDIAAVRRYFDEHVDRSGGEDACWPWGGMSYTRRGGYGYMVIQGKPARHVKAHRLALFFDGRDPGTLGALHSCDNPCCCNPRHLRPGNDAANAADRVARGRTAQPGLRIPNGELERILDRYAAGETCVSIARSYDVRAETINAICLGRERVAPETAKAYLPEWKRRGLRKANARLSDADIVEIDSRHRAGTTQGELAGIYGVTSGTICRALQRWRAREAA